jgi:hypothetical protein
MAAPWDRLGPGPAWWHRRPDPSIRAAARLPSSTPERLSAIEQWDLPEAEALANELRLGLATLASGETAAGAAGFAAGQGRHGGALPQAPGAETRQ